jgi:hypothetical protein
VFRASVCVAATIAAVAAFAAAQAGAAGSPQTAWAKWDNVAADTTNASTFVVSNGATTTVRFDYALTGTSFCTNADGTGTGSSSSSIQTLDASSPGMVVSAPISGLTPGATYCATAVATNASGTAHSDFDTFTAGAPSAESDDAEATGPQTAIVTGSANAAGQANATVRVDYGLASSQWCTDDGTTGPAPSHTANQSLGASDTDDHPQTVQVGGLTPGQDYCAEIVATTPAASSALGGTVAFTAGSPTADTASVAVTGAGTVTVAGSVDPAGQQTTYKAEYDTDASLYCQDPDSNIPAHSTVPVVLPVADTSSHAVSVGIAGLTAAAGYCARITATNGSGVAVSDPIDFQAGAATVATGSVTVTGATTADVSGTVNPGGSSTSYGAEFDTADSPWCQGTDGATPGHTTTPQPLGAADASDHPVVVGLSGLAAGTGYCVDIHATNAGGAVSGDQVTFTATAAIATVSRVFSTATTTAQVDGSVNPSGQQTSVAVGYDLASSPWCVSRIGSPAHSTAPTSLGQTDTAAHNVTVNLSGLTLATRYCAAIVATNAVTATSDSAVFTAGAPVVSEAEASALTPTSERVAGAVAAAGQAGTTYHVDYAPANSQFCQSAGTAGASTTTAPLPLGFAGTDSHPVTIDLAGLTPGVTYCWRIGATNSTSASGPLHQFTAGLAQATTDAAAAPGATHAMLAGRVNGENLPTTFDFEWDSAASQWCASDGATGAAAHTTTKQPLGVTDTNAHAVAEQITGLTGGAGYCYRLTAQNLAGRASGGVVDLTTTTPGSGGGGGSTPSVTTGAATGITATAANLHGTLNPNGSATAYHFDYGAGTSYGSATPTQDAGAGSGVIAVAAPITGLAPSTEYHFCLVAENDAGRSEGPDMTFTTAAPAGDGGGGPGLPGAPGTILVHTSQVSRRLDRVTGKVVIGEDGSTFRAQVLWAGRLARTNVVGRLVMRGLRRGVVPFTVKLGARARKTFKPKKRVTLRLRTTVAPRTGTPVFKQKRVVLRRKPAR